MIHQNSFVSMPRVAHRYETAWGGFKQTFLEMVWLQFDQRWQNPIFFLKRLVTYVTNSTHYCQAVGTEPVLTLLFISQLQTVSLAFHVVIVDLPRIHTGFSPTPHIFSPPPNWFLCSSALYWLCRILFWHKYVHYYTMFWLPNCIHEKNKSEKSDLYKEWDFIYFNLLPI